MTQPKPKVAVRLRPTTGHDRYRSDLLNRAGRCTDAKTNWDIPIE
jgi:hypothetical protein